MKLEELERIIELSWSKDTCVDSLKNIWNGDNKSLGQCAVTSLIVNLYMGGKIMRCMCETGSHYYNLLNDNIVDLTVDQFKSLPDYKNGEERTEEYLLSNEDTKNRYLLLLNNVKENFLKYGSKEYKLLDENGNFILSKVPGTIGGHKKLKIYGKMDCPSALSYIKKGQYVNNRVFFLDEETAIKNGYRPCAKCLKKEYIIWKNKKD